MENVGFVAFKLYNCALSPEDPHANWAKSTLLEIEVFEWYSSESCRNVPPIRLVFDLLVDEGHEDADHQGHE